MSDDEAAALAYVNAAAALLAVPLAAGQAERVATHLARTAAMAGLLEGAALAPHDEPDEIYCPAPFPIAGKEDVA